MGSDRGGAAGDLDISGLSADSREVRPGYLFAALPGSRFDGLDFVGDALEHGTGKRASALGYLVGGKTGTAEKAGRGGYRKEALISSFVGAFPMTAPRYVVFVMLDEPKGTEATHGFAGGGWTAAPVVSRVVSRVAPILGVEPVDEMGPEIRRAMGLGDEAGAAKLASF